MLKQVVPFVLGIALVIAMFLLGYYLISLLIGMGFLVWLFVLLKKKQDRLEARFRENYDSKKVIHLDRHVTLRAIESRGFAQVQGRGYLILTEEKIGFEMMMTELSWSINVSDIKDAQKLNRLLGVAPGKKMLVISFVSKDGGLDRVAFTVQGLDDWIERLNRSVTTDITRVG